MFTVIFSNPALGDLPVQADDWTLEGSWVMFFKGESSKMSNLVASVTHNEVAAILKASVDA